MLLCVLAQRTNVARPINASGAQQRRRVCTFCLESDRVISCVCLARNFDIFKYLECDNGNLFLALQALDGGASRRRTHIEAHISGTSARYTRHCVYLATATCGPFMFVGAYLARKRFLKIRTTKSWFREEKMRGFLKIPHDKIHVPRVLDHSWILAQCQAHALSTKSTCKTSLKLLLANMTRRNTRPKGELLALERSWLSSGSWVPAIACCSSLAA